MKIIMVAQTDKLIPSPKDAIFAPGVIFYSVANGLVKKGHEVTVYATKDSKKCGTKFNHLNIESSHSQKQLSTNDRLFRTEQTELFFISSALEEFNKGSYDLIHFDGPIHAAYFANFTNGPITCIQHGAPDRQHELKLDISRSRQIKYFSKLNYIAISQRQKELGSEYYNYQTVIHHGIDVNEFKFNAKPENELLFMGRIIPEKGVKEAIEISLKTKNKLRIYGEVYNYDYWNKSILPKIDNVNIKYLNHISYNQVDKAYGRSKAMLMPISWDEPFGMTVIESMACGTPVIAFDRGSMSELIIDGETGFIIRPGDMKGFEKAIENIDKIDRNKCREHVRNNFSIEKMVDKYENFFNQVIQKSK